MIIKDTKNDNDDQTQEGLTDKSIIRGSLVTCHCQAGMVGLAPKWVRKSPGFVPFGANLTHFGAKPTIPAWEHHSPLI